ncbi:hypothetical protein EV122DRAFT_283774 [Schizophyllum commune]|nr:hypothetical protein K525DRAFT_274858 [Schizophyllum commune Loenen D]
MSNTATPATAFTTEVLALLNAAFSERDEAKLRLEIANMKLDSFKRQEEKEADARDVQQQLVMSCRRQVADLRDVKANFVRLHNSFSSKMRSLRQDPDRIHEVIRELESALQTYELTKVKYADDEDLETSFYDEEHM